MRNKRTFEQAFNAVFHDSASFREFLLFDVDSGVGELRISTRTIRRITSPLLKKYLRFIDKVILKHLSCDGDVVHSYIKSKSTLTAVDAHRYNKYFFLTDIKDFFPNISTEHVRDVLERDKYLIPISDYPEYIDLIVRMTTVGGSIPVGFPTSPQLSNAFLCEFDRELKSYCNDRGFTYTRYADDIVISSNEPDELYEISGVVQSLLDKHASNKLRLKEEKTHITHIGNKVKILGLVITPNGLVTIDNKHKKVIESLLHFYAADKDKYEDLLNKSMKGDEKSLFGMLHYANSIDPEYIQKLQRKYGASTLHLLMEDRWSDKR